MTFPGPCRCTKPEWYICFNRHQTYSEGFQVSFFSSPISHLYSQRKVQYTLTVTKPFQALKRIHSQINLLKSCVHTWRWTANLAVHSYRAARLCECVSQRCLSVLESGHRILSARRRGSSWSWGGWCCYGNGWGGVGLAILADRPKMRWECVGWKWYAYSSCMNTSFDEGHLNFTNYVYWHGRRGHVETTHFSVRMFLFLIKMGKQGMEMSSCQCYRDQL